MAAARRGVATGHVAHGIIGRILVRHATDGRHRVDMVGIAYSWPFASSGTVDNYQASGR
jgi:hypothetical protein